MNLYHCPQTCNPGHAKFIFSSTDFQGKNKWQANKKKHENCGKNNV